MLPSSRGPGRSPPQVENGGSNPSGSATYTRIDAGTGRVKPLEDCDWPQNGSANLNPIQNNCKYGWVLPDRCRYNPRLGCDCGAYPPRLWNEEKGFYEPTKDDPRVFKYK